RPTAPVLDRCRESRAMAAWSCCTLRWCVGMGPYAALPVLRAVSAYPDQPTAQHLAAHAFDVGFGRAEAARQFRVGHGRERERCEDAVVELGARHGVALKSMSMPSFLQSAPSSRFAAAREASDSILGADVW